MTEQNKIIKKTLIEENVLLTEIISKDIEAGYYAKRWPFATLRKAKESEDVLFIWVVKPDGKIEIADDSKMWGKQIDDMPHSLEGVIVEDRFYPETNEKIKLIIRPLEIKEAGNPWMLYLGVSLKTVIAARNKMFLVNFGYFAVIIILITIFSFHLTKNITWSLKKLMDGVKAISKGNLNYKIRVKTRDEFERLAAAFNKMIWELKKSRAKLEKYSIILEKRVKGRTMELEKSEKAAYNIMEDLNEANAKLALEKRSVQKKIRERTKELEAAYDELKKLDVAKDEFISMVSHELKSPLFPILGFTELMLNNKIGKLSKEQKEKLGIVYRNAESLKQLIEDMLTISKLELMKMDLKYEKVDLTKAAKEVIKSLSTYAKKKSVTVKFVGRKHHFAQCDKLRMKQVIFNLTRNAISYNRKGGWVKVNVSKENGDIALKVTDNGIGIGKEGMKNLFNKFYQVEKTATRETGGTGLGLAIVKGLIELHGGKVKVESKKGQGSTFTAMIPKTKRVRRKK